MLGQLSTYLASWVDTLGEKNRRATQDMIRNLQHILRIFNITVLQIYFRFYHLMFTYVIVLYQKMRGLFAHCSGSFKSFFHQFPYDV